MPSVTLPNTTCFPSKKSVFVVQMKNCPVSRVSASCKRWRRHEGAMSFFSVCISMVERRQHFIQAHRVSAPVKTNLQVRTRCHYLRESRVQRQAVRQVYSRHRIVKGGNGVLLGLWLRSDKGNDKDKGGWRPEYTTSLGTGAYHVSHPVKLLPESHWTRMKIAGK